MKNWIVPICLALFVCGFVIVPDAMALNGTAIVPDVNTNLVEDAGTKILTAVAVLVAIGMGLRLFKRG